MTFDGSAGRCVRARLARERCRRYGVWRRALRRAARRVAAPRISEEPRREQDPVVSNIRGRVAALACALLAGVVAGGVIATGPAFAATNFTVNLGTVPSSFTAGGPAQTINYVLQRSGTNQQVSISQRAIYIQIAGIELPDVTVTRVGGQSLPVERVDASTVRAVRTDPTPADGGTR